MISQYLSNLVFYEKTIILRVTHSTVKNFRTKSFEQKIIIDARTLREDLVHTKMVLRMDF